MQIGIANGIPLNATITGNDLIPAYDQASGTEGYVNLSNAVQNAFKDSGAGTANGVLYLDGNRAVTSGSALVFDGANLGLGTVPSGWAASAKAFQIKSYTSLAERVGTSDAIFSWNATAASGVSSGTGYVYRITGDLASAYEQNGAHRWYTAPSGTAGQPISFTQAMTLDASGNLLVGTTSANTNLAKGVQIASTNWGMYAATSAVTGAGCSIIAERANDGNVGQFYRNAVLVGSISVTASATAYNTSSDYRLKDNQAPLTGSGTFIDALKPKTWSWKADGTKGVGFIAHEVQEVSPTSVVGEKDAMRVEQYEVSPAVPATCDEQGNELTPAVEAVMGEREVPAYQAMEYGSAEFIANIVAELQSLRKRVAALEAK